MWEPMEGLEDGVLRRDTCTTRKRPLYCTTDCVAAGIEFADISFLCGYGERDDTEERVPACVPSGNDKGAGRIQ